MQRYVMTARDHDLIRFLLLAAVLSRSAGVGRADEASLERFEFRQIEMAVDIRVVLYAADAKQAEAAAKSVFDRFHQLNAVLSDYDPDSELERLCATAGQGKAVRVSDDLWRVLAGAQQMAERSEGAFDATCGAIVRLWRRARRQHELPSPERLHEALTLTGYKLVRLDPAQHTVELLRPGMRLDLGGIAKGYATGEGLTVLRRHGITRAMIEAGGDVMLGDAPPGQPGWRIGLAPSAPKGPPRYYLRMANSAVSTSGDMWQYVVIDGKRYSHVVDPHTGLGLTDHCYVNVTHPDGATADALAKVVSVLGPEKGLEIVDSTSGAAALIIRSNEGSTEVHTSRGWSKLDVKPAERN